MNRLPSLPLLLRSSALLLGTLIAIVGCGGKEAKDSVSGTVTVGGKNVTSGEVVLAYADGKEAKGGILNGTYKVENPPKGEASVLVKSPPGMIPPVAPPKGGIPGGSVKDKGATLGGGGGELVYPPAKYGMANNGLPKLNVTGGKQTHNIDLAP